MFSQSSCAASDSRIGFFATKNYAQSILKNIQTVDLFFSNFDAGWISISVNLAANF